MSQVVLQGTGAWDGSRWHGDWRGGLKKGGKIDIWKGSERDRDKGGEEGDHMTG